MGEYKEIEMEKHEVEQILFDYLKSNVEINVESSESETEVTISLRNPNIKDFDHYENIAYDSSNYTPPYPTYPK